MHQYKSTNVNTIYILLNPILCNFLGTSNSVFLYQVANYINAVIMYTIVSVLDLQHMAIDIHTVIIYIIVCVVCLYNFANDSYIVIMFSILSVLCLYHVPNNRYSAIKCAIVSVLCLNHNVVLQSPGHSQQNVTKVILMNS